jgi:deoxyribodipyrimidine photolyase
VPVWLQLPCGADKTGPYRAKFLLECIADLRRRLRDQGSDLIVRVGKPEEVSVPSTIWPHHAPGMAQLN